MLYTCDWVPQRTDLCIAFLRQEIGKSCQVYAVDLRFHGDLPSKSQQGFNCHLNDLHEGLLQQFLTTASPILPSAG